MARRRPDFAASMASYLWMMQAASHGCSFGWPGGRGSRSSSGGVRGLACGVLLPGVEPPAWDLAGVLALSGPRQALTNRSSAALLVPSPPLAPPGDLGLLQLCAMWWEPWQLRHRSGWRQVAMRCVYERQFRHLSRRASGIFRCRRGGGRDLAPTRVVPLVGALPV